MIRRPLLPLAERTGRAADAARRHATGLALLAASTACGCSSTNGTPVDVSALPPGCDALITPGGGDDTEAVQTVFIETPDRRTICLGSGHFTVTSELSISTSNVTLRGAGREETTLDFTGQSGVAANGLVITGDGVTLADFQVKNTPGDGIRANDVSDIHFKNVGVMWDAKASTKNGAYGLYPVGSDGVRIEGCVVSGARDAGIYVGQSQRILVRDSEVYGNVAGIEIENSSDGEVRDNYAHDNTAGLLVFNLPNLPVQDGKRAKVHHNKVEANNLDNFAEAGTTVADVLPGTGVMILAADTNEIHDNTIKDNKTFGAFILSYNETFFEKPDDPKFNHFPQGNWIHDNVFSGNGGDPAEGVNVFIPVSPVPDIIWDGCEEPAVDNTSGMLTNCLSNNGAATYRDMDICKDSGGASSDVAKVTCEHTALPPQDP